MAFPQFGYPNIGASLPGNQNSLLLAAASAVNAPSSGASSRHTEAPNRDAPASSTPSSTAAQCPCYPPGLIGSYPRMPGGLPEPNPAAAAAAATAALYGGAYPPGYLSLGAGEAVMNSMCGDLKSTPELGLVPGSPYFPAYELAGFPYHNGFALDPNARRKNATRESTTTLKAWLNEHRKNPYPTKGEKIMLAIITKMTLTQVSTWFANARRRLKKDNKVTWSPRNRGEDDDDDDDDENGRDKDEKDEEFDVDIENDDDAEDSPLPRSSNKAEMSPLPSSPPPVAYSTHSAFTPINHLRSPPKQPLRVSTATPNKDSASSSPSSRSTKIWSLAEVASSKEHKSETDTPAFVTRGPTQQTFAPNQKAPHAAGFSAFRPLLHGVPPQSLAGGPIQWPGSQAGGPHPAYSYALSQHYLAMTMARPGFIPASFHHPQDSKLAGVRQDTKCSSPDSSRSVSPSSPSQSPFRPHRPQVTSSSSSSSLALAASANE